MRFAAVAATIAACCLAVSAAAVPSVNGRLSLDVIGAAPVPGKTFRVDANVYSDRGPGEGPLSFTLTLNLPQGLNVLEWSNPFLAPACTQTGRTVRCTGQVIGVDFTTWITFKLRTLTPGAYALSGVIDVAGDANTVDNTSELDLRVPAASGNTGVTRRGTARSDVLVGTGGNDSLSGFDGNDVLRGLAGADSLNGGRGTDRLDGGPGNDTIGAKDGARDRVACGAGRDVVTADRADRLVGCEVVRQLSVRAIR